MTADLLPQLLRDWAVDISERMQAPLDYVAASAVVIVGSLIGRRLAVFPKRYDDWHEYPNLWGVLVGGPAAMKSPSLGAAMKPLENLARNADARFADEENARKPELIANQIRLEAARKRLKGCEDEDAIVGLATDVAKLEATGVPFRRRYKTQDATVEKVGLMLNENPNGMLIQRDELAGFLENLDRPGHNGDRAFYLEAWNGKGSFNVDRIGRGELHIPALTLSILGTIQPGPLQTYVRQTIGVGGSNDGLLQRFQLLVYPDPPVTWEHVDREPNREAWHGVVKLFEQLDRLDRHRQLTERTVTDGVSGLRFAPDAQPAFDAWLQRHERRLRSGEIELPALVEHLTKYRKLVPALALVFELCTIRVFGDLPEDISLESMQRAGRWAVYLESHALRVYGWAPSEAETAAINLAGRIRKGKLSNGFSSRDVYRKHWSGLKSSEAVDAALQTLEACNYVRRREASTGGRPTVVFEINPQVCESG